MPLTDDFQTRYTVLKQALDETGVGHDYADRLRPVLESIATFCADLQRRATQQAVYNALHNVPCGIYQPADCTAEAALRSAVAGAVGQFVQWDINGALHFAADIAEDVNAHHEAEIIREFIEEA